MLVMMILAFSGFAIILNFLALPKTHPKRPYVILALCCTAIAFVGQIATSRDNRKMRTEPNSIGTPATEWFPVNDADTQKFTISHRPITGSIEVQVNGLPEEPDTYSVQGSDIFVRADQQPSDRIAIKYRYVSHQ